MPLTFAAATVGETIELLCAPYSNAAPMMPRNAAGR